MACILPLQGRRTNLPCYHLALRLPRGKAPQRVGCYPSSSITAGLCRRSLAYYYKVSSVRSSKTMFGSALRVPLSPPGTRFDVLHCVLFSSQLLTDVLRKTAFSCIQCYFTILEKVCQICLRCSMPGAACWVARVKLTQIDRRFLGIVYIIHNAFTFYALSALFWGNSRYFKHANKE